MTKTYKPSQIFRDDRGRKYTLVKVATTTMGYLAKPKPGGGLEYYTFKKVFVNVKFNHQTGLYEAANGAGA
jgi:hypothetical protein